MAKTTAKIRSQYWNVSRKTAFLVRSQQASSTARKLASPMVKAG